MSRENREALIQEIGMQSARWQEDVQRFDAAAAALLGVNSTDLRCAFLLTEGEMTAKELAEETGLTPGAVTTVIDRLEDSELARRRHDQADRRRVLVELTSEARRKLNDIWGPLAVEGAALMRRYSTAELQLLCDFIVKVREIQQAHIARLEGRKHPAA
jgi:DNA-binding MarR family transcriptional regulator